MEQKEIVILVGLKTRDPDQSASESTLDELESLVRTAGGEVVARVFQQRDTPDVRYYIGEGKAQEVAQLCRTLDAGTVVFDNELSPSQAKALEDLLGVQVVDRSLLILNIFADRAQSREGRVQVELARLKYILPRLAGQGVQMSRLGGGGAGGGGARRGAGETKLETQRRHIRQRIHKLETELRDVSHVRQIQRHRRVKNETPTVALIGYTNAGKSTLQSKLCKVDVQTGDRLFDTLDPSTRRWHVAGGKTVLLTDTVGFIRKLPHHLVEAFQSTLEELTYADLLLHVIDVSHPEWLEQAEVVDDLVEHLGAQNVPCLRVYNKTDVLNAELLPAGVRISAKHGANFDALRAAVLEALAP